MSNVNLIPLVTISNLFKLEVLQMPILSNLYNMENSIAQAQAKQKGNLLKKDNYP